MDQNIIYIYKSALHLKRNMIQIKDEIDVKFAISNKYEYGVRFLINKICGKIYYSHTYHEKTLK